MRTEGPRKVGNQGSKPRTDKRPARNCRNSDGGDVCEKVEQGHSPYYGPRSAPQSHRSR